MATETCPETMKGKGAKVEGYRGANKGGSCEKYKKDTQEM